MPSTATYALSTLAVAALAFLPGLPLAAGLARRARWRLPAVLCASFALQLGIVGAVALIARLLGLTLAAVFAASAVVLALGGIAALWPPRRGDFGVRDLDLGLPALTFGAVGLALGIAERTWFSRMADAFYHLAAVRSLLATGRPMVTDPMFGTSTSGLDPTTGVWHTVLAAWSKATGLDVAAWLWPGAVGVAAALLLMGFWELARRLSGSDAAATFGTLAWLAVGLTADVRWAAYPNRLSLGVAFVALASLASLTVSPEWPDALLAVVAASGAAAMHMAAAAMLAAAGALLLAMLLARAGLDRVRRRACDVRPALALAGVGAAASGLALPLLLPKVPLVRASVLVAFQAEKLALGVVKLPGGLLVDAPGHLMKIAPPLFALGAATALFAAVRAFRGHEPRDLVAAALAGLPVALLADPPVTTPLLQASYYLTERIAILLPFTVFLGVAWALGQPARSRPMRAGVTLAVAAALALTAVSAALGSHSLSPRSRDSVFASRRDDVRSRWGAGTMRALSAEFGERYPVVASDTRTSYYLAGVLPVAVVAVTSQHTAFAIEAVDGQRRRDDMYAVTSPDASEARRREILLRRRADYVVVPRSGGTERSIAAMLREPGLLRLVVDTPSMAVFRVLR